MVENGTHITEILQCIKIQAIIYVMNHEHNYGHILTSFLPFKLW